VWIRFRFSELLRHSSFVIWPLLTLPLAAAAQLTNDIPPLRPPHMEIPPTFLEQHGWSASIGAVALLALAGFAVWRRLQPKPESAVPPEVQVKHALESLRLQSETGAVLSRISQALRRYLLATFGLPPEELTTTEFCRALADSTQVGPELSLALSQFLRECDRLKFAPSASPTELNAAARALELVASAEGRRAQLRQSVASAPNPPSKPE
jgi:MYXO-CTERM domain-containing protein